MRRTRNNQGAIAVVLLLFMVMLTVTVSAFAFDYAHALMVKESLQSATDAGALAGAMELAKNNLSDIDISNSRNFAREVTSRNHIEDIEVSSEAPGTVVEVYVDAASMPRSVTVTAVRYVDTFFARAIGWNFIAAAATSTASAEKGILKVKPNQLLPLAISLDHRPEEGPQRGISLQDSISGEQPFKVILNPTKHKNSAWLNDWTGTENPLITIGADTLTMNGVNANKVAGLRPGDNFNVPLVMGGPPFNDTRQVVGVVGFEVTRNNFPLSIEGTIRNPAHIRGTPGKPDINGLSLEGQMFLDQNQPWHVSLSY